MDLAMLRSRLYFITPSDLAGRDGLMELVRAVVEAGAGMVQYRAKGATTRVMIEDCQRLLRHTRRVGAPLVVDDRADVALAVGADGVHVGSEDLPVAYARRLMGPHAIIGATAPTPRLAREAELGDANYLAVGPIFADSGAESEALGPEAMVAVRAVTRLPICAAGGITADSLGLLSAFRPDLVAVSGAIADAADPGAEARRLVGLLASILPPGGDAR
jgi:thiamine-phosphate pyrophosphorylase